MSKKPSVGFVIAAALAAFLGIAVVIGIVYGIWVLIAWLFVATFNLQYNIWLLGGCGLVGTMILKKIFKRKVVVKLGEDKK